MAKAIQIDGQQAQPPEVRRAIKAYKRGKITRAVEVLIKTRQPPWQARARILDALAEQAPLPSLDEQCRYEPTSPDSWLLRGLRRIFWAWEARGSGRASEVEEEEFREFFARLYGAESDLLWAAELAPEDPQPHCELIRVAMGMSQGTEVVQQHFREACHRDPKSLAAHQRATYALTKKWGGSHELMYELAHQAVAQANPQNNLMTVLFSAHFEHWLYLRSFEEDADAAKVFINNLETRREAAREFDRSLGSEKPRNGGESEWNEVAFWFYLTRDKKRLTKALSRIGKAWKSSPWGHLGDPAEVIGMAKGETA